MYRTVTDRLIDLLEQGPAPWRKPWYHADDFSHLPQTPIPMTPASYGPKLPESGTVIPVRDDELDSGTSCRGGITVLPDQLLWNEFVPIDSCEAIIATIKNMRYPPIIQHGGEGCSYCRSRDMVQLPERRRFVSPELYYSSLFHEMVHATGHDSRLARYHVVNYDGGIDHAYYREELLAETGAAFLSAHAGIEEITLPNSASYLNHFLDKLNSDPQELVNAVPAAKEAVEYYLNKQEGRT